MDCKNVVWDWNGTLLDDVEAGLDTLNEMLGKRGLPLLTLSEYRSSFGFPVIDFYHRIGFDMERESFHELSVDFVRTYESHAATLRLNREVREVLAVMRERGKQQYVLSALREDLLKKMLRDFQIDSCFDGVCGSDNIYANGKIGQGRHLMECCNFFPAETVMIGDTVHDAEVAAALGCNCILFAGGHNDEQRLQEHAPVIHRMGEVPDRIR